VQLEGNEYGRRIIQPDKKENPMKNQIFYKKRSKIGTLNTICRVSN